jgi:flagellar biosynthesis/type III secretory pathway protein FliH
VRLHAPPATAVLSVRDAEALLGEVTAARVAAARAEGLAEGQRLERERSAAALDQAAERLDRAREEAAATIARDTVQLALEIARTLVRVEVDAGRHDLESMVRDALTASGVGRGPCVVHMNPHDAAALSGVRFRSGTTIEPDEAIARGDVHVSTPSGLLVREIPEALRSIHERLLAELS